jgi:hypothetical protein
MAFNRSLKGKYQMQRACAEKIEWEFLNPEPYMNPLVGDL